MCIYVWKANTLNTALSQHRRVHVSNIQAVKISAVARGDSPFCFSTSITWEWFRVESVEALKHKEALTGGFQVRMGQLSSEKEFLTDF